MTLMAALYLHLAGVLMFLLCLVLQLTLLGRLKNPAARPEALALHRKYDVFLGHIGNTLMLGGGLWLLMILIGSFGKDWFRTEGWLHAKFTMLIVAWPFFFMGAPRLRKAEAAWKAGDEAAAAKHLRFWMVTRVAALAILAAAAALALMKADTPIFPS